MRAHSVSAGRRWSRGLATLLPVAAACADPAREAGPVDLPPARVVPSPEQVAYQEREIVGFLHFSVNTFTDREWGLGDESPDEFAPTGLDVDQWAAVAAETGIRELILTAKHHDGFCLWPSAMTSHSVRSSAWRSGEGDVVRAFVEAARRHGLEVGLYVSPWDRNHADYGRPAYVDAWRGQLRELLTGYGRISEVWFDGANGGTGYYGGANEERRIDRATYYGWPETWALVRSLQPGALIFSDAGPDIRWVGNEHGDAGETSWSTIDVDGIVVGAADPAYLNSGDPAGDRWVVPQCDVSIRPGWFYHPGEDGRVKTPQELVEIYYRSVGRNCVLLLNVPPDRRGRIHENDVRALREFRRILDETFAVDLAAGRPARADDVRRGGEAFAPANLVDGDTRTYWAASDGRRSAALEVELEGPRSFDRILLQEPIRLGQRISRFEVDVRAGQGAWETVARGTTIGHKRLLRFERVEADRVRVRILGALEVPALSSIGVFRASPDEPRP